MAIQTLTQQNFQRVVQDNHIVLVDFWASWCGYCTRFAPIYHTSAQRHPEIVHGKVDGDAERELVAAAGVTAYPTVIAFREGLMVYSKTGAMPAAEFEDLVQEVLWMDMDKVRRELAEQQAATGSAPGTIAEPSGPRAGLPVGPSRYGWPGLR